ncbi:hypothetical protein BXZ70DRAFT_1002843 [Cristinia sonorae]|uniref:histidine kinase n=1 Tax=Cristinia sonorae TaxID=1940300 RepID=A0A8K0UEE6_9AGAR|nr:hypothetical protein BXZ70DRAFT_1002843 [Cristinia sonorae]
MPSKEECELSAEKYNVLGTRTPLTPGFSSTLLPAPAVQSSISHGRNGKTRKSARINGSFRMRFDRLFRRLTAGTAPSTSSNIDESIGESSGYNRSRIGNIRQLPEDPDEPVDEVVVDREWSVEIKSSSVTHSEHGATPEKSGGSNHVGGTNTDHDSAIHHVGGFWGLCGPLIYIRWRIYPNIHSFFWSRFLDEKSEQHYKKETWFLRKNLAIWAASFYVLNWALGVALIPKPVVRSDEVFFYAVAPALTILVLPMVMFDWPRDRPALYQVLLMIATWMWGWYQILFMFFCGKYGTRSYFDCGGKDFLATFYYTTALQTIAIFGLSLQRFPAMCGALIFFGLACGLIVPARTTFIRNVVNFVCFQAFLLYIHYMRETAERRLYTLRDQLKVQFRATQKAQVNERKAADSKRRLTSYVRVPLNTALLAVQNMDASGVLPKGQEIEFKALEGSLNMMSKVLNDVLDFNRMDSGRFESVLKPYAFHQVLRSLFIPLKLATDARGLEFVIDLDQSIDDIARRALYEAAGENKETIARRLAEITEEDGIVVGDETRLRQIITNLASNACKFTPAGGTLTITTKLVIPSSHKHDMDDLGVSSSSNTAFSPSPPSEMNGEHVVNEHQKLSAKRLRQHDVMHSKPPPPLEWIVVRIEVSDTGCGIRPKDMVQSKLFSAFNQTEQGRQQGGKGTGLGLALVRQIVKLSGGRLGVQSKVNEGSTFWVELPLGVGQKAMSALVDGHMSQGSQDNLKLAIKLPGSGKPGKSVTVTDLAPSGRRNLPTHSALHNVMEQGGLVELSTSPGDSSIVTRTIGDPSTGTDLLVKDEYSSPAPSLSDGLNSSTPSAPTTSAPSIETVRPNHLQLPKPQRFSMDEPINDVSPAASTSTQTGSAVSNATASTQASVPYDSGMKVLVVDDDPLTRKLMSRMLTRLGCKVWTAENGEVAMELILGNLSNLTRTTPSSEDTGSAGLSLSGINEEDKHRFAVVFLDNQMPVMSGLEAVAKLRGMGRRDFIVGVTGNALLTDQQEYLEAGVDHVLTKPVYEKSLKNMLAIADERMKRGTPFMDPPPSSPFVPPS